MPKWLLVRWRVLKAVVWGPKWSRIVLVVWGVVGIYSTVRSEFLSEEMAKAAPPVRELLMFIPEFAWQTWLLILAGILLVALFEYAVGLRRLADKPPKVERSSVRNFHSRDELEKAFPLREQLKEGNAIHAFWTAGQGIVEYHAEELQTGVVKNVVLPRPDLSALQHLTNSIQTGKAYALPGQIRANTELFKDFGAKVFWHDEFLGLSGHIGNPGREDGWVIAEFALPFENPTRREIMRIQGKDVVDKWFKWYQKLLAGSVQQ
jgi:hypothetical protein